MLGSSSVSAMKGCSTSHTAHGEELKGQALGVQFNRSFVPVNLRLSTPVIALRDADLSTDKSHLCLSRSDISAHGGFADVKLGHLLVEPGEYAAGRMALLAR